jgi:hypothetical protein
MNNLELFIIASNSEINLWTLIMVGLLGFSISSYRRKLDCVQLLSWGWFSQEVTLARV